MYHRGLDCSLSLRPRLFLLMHKSLGHFVGTPRCVCIVFLEYIYKFQFVSPFKTCVVIGYSKKANCSCMRVFALRPVFSDPIRRGLRRVGRRDRVSWTDLWRNWRNRNMGGTTGIRSYWIFVVPFLWILWFRRNIPLTVQQGRELWVTDYRSWCSSPPPPSHQRKSHTKMLQEPTYNHQVLS